MGADQLGSIALIIGAIGVLIATITTSFVTIRSALRVESKVDAVHDEVRTGNGQTLGMLADIAEGRAAQAIAPEDRTEAEQHHADMKTETEATAGEQPKA